MITLYGIANCDTIKKTRQWLDKQSVHYTFHDYKKLGLSEPLISELMNALPLEELVNKRGTTWRQLPPEAQHAFDTTTAPALLVANPSLIRRPVLRNGNAWIAGYDEARLQLFIQHK